MSGVPDLSSATGPLVAAVVALAGTVAVLVRARMNGKTRDLSREIAVAEREVGLVHDVRDLRDAMNDVRKNVHGIRDTLQGVATRLAVMEHRVRAIEAQRGGDVVD